MKMIHHRNREHIQLQAVLDVYPQAVIAIGIIYSRQKAAYRLNSRGNEEKHKVKVLLCFIRF
jgi:hypothetical protein